MNENIRDGNSPSLDTTNYVDFYVFYSDYLNHFIETNPYVKMMKIIDMYAIISIREDKIAEILDAVAFNRGYVYPVVMGLVEEIDKTPMSLIPKSNYEPFLGITGKDVLIAIIDTGIDYTKDVFRSKDGATRIEYIWDQTLPSNESKGVVFGAEYSKVQINEALKLENPLDLVPHEDHNGHGTFLASIAGGSDTEQFIGMAPDAEFLIVKLRKANPYYIDRYAVPKEIENVFSAADVMLAIEYVLEKAAELQKPVSVCLALGTNIGGHDGYSVLEEYISSISRKSSVCMTSAAGNERVIKHHTSGKLDATKEKEIDIQVKNPIEGFFLTLIMGSSDRYMVSVVLPSGDIIGPVPARSGTQLGSLSVIDNSYTLIRYHLPAEGSGAQITTIKISQPTVGIVKVIIHPESILEGIYNAWLPISTLSAPGIEFLEPEEHQTIVVPGTSISCITCGAYDSSTNELYHASSWGPTRLSIIKPDFVAPGVRMVGMYPSGYGVMTGTGVSAAYTAGSCANILQWGAANQYDINLNTIRIKSYLIRGCIRDDDVSYPNDKWGYGKLSIENTFNSIKSN